MFLADVPYRIRAIGERGSTALAALALPTLQARGADNYDVVHVVVLDERTLGRHCFPFFARLRSARLAVDRHDARSLRFARASARAPSGSVCLRYHATHASHVRMHHGTTYTPSPTTM